MFELFVTFIISLILLILFIRLCIHVSTIKKSHEKQINFTDVYQMHLYFDDEDKALEAAKLLIWKMRNKEYYLNMDKQASLLWLRENVRPLFEKKGIDWPKDLE